MPVTQIANNPELTANITNQLITKASYSAMNEMMTSIKNIVNSLRYVPLAIKKPVASIIYCFLADGVYTTTLSNLGIVTMPSGYASYIESFDFLLDPAITNRANCSMVTFGNISTLSISKITTDPSFEESLFRYFAEDGVVPDVRGSPIYED